MSNNYIMITLEIKNFINSQKLGYVATVTPDGKPNISPKGTIIGWTSHLLAFADIRSPDTMHNLQDNPNVEINVIDPILRKGYLFEGTATILDSATPPYSDILHYYRTHGIKSPIGSIVLVDVLRISPVISPLYDMGVSESEVKLRWRKYFTDL